jgi:hypothetical protein
MGKYKSNEIIKKYGNFCFLKILNELKNVLVLLYYICVCILYILCTIVNNNFVVYLFYCIRSKSDLDEWTQFLLQFY